MKFPLFGVLAAVTTGMGAFGICHYSNLSRSEQEELDQVAVDTAKWLYNKGLNELSAEQFRRVQEVVKSRLLS